MIKIQFLAQFEEKCAIASSLMFVRTSVGNFFFKFVPYIKFNRYWCISVCLSLKCFAIRPSVFGPNEMRSSYPWFPRQDSIFLYLIVKRWFFFAILFHYDETHNHNIFNIKFITTWSFIIIVSCLQFIYYYDVLSLLIQNRKCSAWKNRNTKSRVNIKMSY